MTMPEQNLDRLLDDTDARLFAARTIVSSGGAVDLGDLLSRLQEICDGAIAGRRKDLMPRLQHLIEQLNELETALCQLVFPAEPTVAEPTIAEPVGSAITHRQAVGIYESAAGPKQRQ